MFKKVNRTSVDILPMPIVYHGITLDALATAWVVYEVWNGSTLVYIGTCRFTAFGQLPDACNNATFAKLVTRDQMLSIRIIASGNRHDCSQYRMKCLRDLESPPVANVRAIHTRGSSIMCNEDGRIFATQAEAAKAYNIAAGNLSAHLNGYPAHQTVNGLTFKRIPR